MNQTSPTLVEAIAFLDAVHVEPPFQSMQRRLRNSTGCDSTELVANFIAADLALHGAYYAFRNPIGKYDPYYIVRSSTMTLIDTSQSKDNAVTWLSLRHYATPMPAWWCPERQFAVVGYDRERATERRDSYATCEEALAAADTLDKVICIDFTTGFEARIR